MQKRAPHSLLIDLDRFLVIADHLTNGRHTSFRAIARAFKPILSVSAVTDCVDRLEKQFGVILISRALKAWGENSLTADGRKLTEDVRRLNRWRPGGSEDLRVALSHSLLTSQLLTPAVVQFRDELGQKVKLVPHVRVDMDFRRIVRDLQSHELDLALTWGFNERLRTKYPGLSSTTIGPPFDVVFIGQDRASIEALWEGRAQESDPDFGRLVDKKIIILGNESQFGLDKLDWPNHLRGGEWIEVDTIELVVAFVRAGLVNMVSCRLSTRSLIDSSRRTSFSTHGLSIRCS